MRPSWSITNPDPVPRPTWIITVAGSTRLATSTVLALSGAGATGVRVTPGVAGAEGLAVVADESARWASAAPPYPAAPPIRSAVRAATAITGNKRGRRRFESPGGRIAVVAEDVMPPAGPSATGGWPSGGGKIASCAANAGSGGANGCAPADETGGSPKGPK